MVVCCTFYVLLYHHAGYYPDPGSVPTLVDLPCCTFSRSLGCCSYGVHLCHICISSHHRHLERVDVSPIVSHQIIVCIAFSFVRPYGLIIHVTCAFSSNHFRPTTTTVTDTWPQEPTQSARSFTVSSPANAGTAPKVFSLTKRSATT